MRRAFFLSVFVLCLMMLIVSCASKTEFDDGEYFQAMGYDGDVVVHVNLGSGSHYIPEELESLSRYADSVSFVRRGESVFGAVTGSFSRLVAGIFGRKAEGRTGMSFSNRFPGLVLFGSDESSLFTSELETVTARTTLIDDSDAALINGCDIAVYSRKPTDLTNLGFDIPSYVVEGMETILVLIHGETMDVRMTFDSEAKATIVSVIVRSAYAVSEQIKGNKPLAEDLAKIFGRNGGEITMTGIEVPEEIKGWLI